MDALGPGSRHASGPTIIVMLGGARPAVVENARPEVLSSLRRPVYNRAFHRFGPRSRRDSPQVLLA